MLKQSLVIAAALLLAAFSASAEAAATWRTVEFKFEIKGKEQTFRVQFPEGEGPIRGAIRSKREFNEVAFKHRLAVFNRFDETGPSQEFLAAAAEACKRPELEFAGAVVIGCSAGGRKAAQWGGFNPERTLVVFLDHSWAGLPDTKPANDYGNLPIVPGVPMCFTATHDNMYQGGDRRKFHYQWCTAALRMHQQPCTTSIYYEETGHCKSGSRELQAAWLDEALALRIPDEIPIGKPYRLRPVSIRTGGVVKADLAFEGARSYHDLVALGPAGAVKKFKAFNFWVPGPKTAKLYLEWVEKNGGRVATDAADRIPAPLR